MGFLVAQLVKDSPAMQETPVPSLGWKDPLEEGMETFFFWLKKLFFFFFPSKESACNLGDLGWEDLLEEDMATHSSILAWRIPMDRGAWWATVLRVAKSQTRLSN